MRPVKQLSRSHNTTLESLVKVGERITRVNVSVPGRDVWAYQMAKIRLQEAELARRRALSQ